MKKTILCVWLGLLLCWLFTLDYAEGEFVFTVAGFGHGVGMSQYGARILAAEGSGYAEILAHYYQGRELTVMQLG